MDSLDDTLERALDDFKDGGEVESIGHLKSAIGLSLRAIVPGLRLGDVVRIERAEKALLAEVVGFDFDESILLPLGDARGVGPGDIVRPVGADPSIIVGEGLMGRVLNGMGQPMDDGPAIEGERWPLHRRAPSPLTRRHIEEPFVTKVRAIDGLMTLGRGQRVGLFSGSGVGKSTLLAKIAEHAQADVVVVAMIGERGREVREFLDHRLGPSGRERSIVVSATSDESALVRVRSAWVATSIAEYFREQGKDVLLFMDSVTRFARALREVGLAANEPPARRGYPPSVFSTLPKLLERAGNSDKGTLTAVYSVLVEGDDLEEPIADEVRGILDGHIVLRRELAARGRYPAIDPLRSISRVMDLVTDEEQQQNARELLRDVSTYESKRDLVLLGAYENGADPALDQALRRLEKTEAFLAQDRAEISEWEQTLDRLRGF